MKRYLIKFFPLEIKKFKATLFCGLIIISLPLTAQDPYTHFPKDSICWGYHYSNYLTGENPRYIVYNVNGKEIQIEGKTYTQIEGGEKGFIEGIREENKKIFAYIPYLGEHILYDFNLEIGDTIFYSIGTELSFRDGWKYHNHEHYAVVIEKGQTTLKNGYVRNTLYIKKEGGVYNYYSYSLWIEGIGEISRTGLLDPLDIGIRFLNGDSYDLGCIYNCFYYSIGCVIYYSSGDCPCSPVNIFEKEKNKKTFFPNPNNGKLSVVSIGCKMENIEIFDVLGRKQIIKEKKLKTDGIIEVDISHFETGIYFLKINNQTQKIIKL